MVIRGKGRVVFGENVQIGVINSPHYISSYGYIEPRLKDAVISIGDNTSINNGVSLVAEKNITIGKNVLMGYNCQVTDSNFHDLHPKKRLQPDNNPKAVKIGNNVFLGNNVTILKGVELGDNTVVGAASVVTKSFPENVILAGNPAKVIQKLSDIIID
ncbi:acyltransferase [Formosa haliotis]|uniref:acyltransferase n=1 Tax=Formosa haliotis TaxID=1555194 RepID=UPI0009F5D859|nr:acyltransferase [Formosa haliotis]